MAMIPLFSAVNEKGETILEGFGPPNALAPDADGAAKALYVLTEVLVRAGLAENEGGGLAGEFGRGCMFENDVFLMHPFCWCERDDCPWCTGCRCPDPAPEHYLDGRLVDDWHETNCRLVAPLPWEVAERETPEYECASEAFDRSIEERNARLVTVHAKRVHACTPAGLMEDREAGLDWRPDQLAPHFWHKPTGAKIWWYKWIGRDMETNRPDADWASIFRECFESVPPEARERARHEHERENSPTARAAREEWMRAAMAAMGEYHAHLAPCATCSAKGRENGLAWGGGEMNSGAGRVIVRTFHEMPDAPCSVCGHVNTTEEARRLEDDEAAMADDLRRRLSEVRRLPQRGASRGTPAE